MIFPFSKILIGIGTVVGSGGVGLLATYESTKKTILDGLDGKRIVSTDETKSTDLDDVWNKLKDKLKGNNGATSPETKTQRFKEVQTSLTTVNSSEKLKKLCGDVGKEIYSTIFSSDDSLLSDVETFCTIKIEDILGSSHVFNTSIEDDTVNNDKDALNNKLTSLKTHSENSTGKLPEFLQKIKDELTTDPVVNDGKWKKLAEWCGKAYKFSFFDKSENLWKQVEAYCKK